MLKDYYGNPRGHKQISRDRRRSFICLIMADRSDENKKEFSIDELNARHVKKLRKYLKNQGVVITTDTRKRDLVLKVYHACRLDLLLCSTKEQDDAQIKAR